MAYTTFSTDNADYVLQLVRHDKPDKVDIFKGIDALVIELGRGELLDFITDWKTDPNYGLPLLHCANNRASVFATDVNLTFIGQLRNANPISLSLEAPVLCTAMLSYHIFREKKIHEYALCLGANFSFLTQNAIGEGRNAINARKIEEYVAPLMAERLGRKARLGLIFGAGHIGLKPDLQSKRRRDFTLWNWRNLNFGKWAGFVKEELNLIQEANYNGEEWKIQSYMPNLFD